MKMAKQKFNMEEQELARDGSKSKLICIIVTIFLGLFLLAAGIYLAIVVSTKESKDAVLDRELKKNATKMDNETTTNP